MKALLITPETQTIEEIDIGNSGDIVEHIGYDTIASDEIGEQGDRLFFDEECFLRGSSGRFQIDTLVPVSGKGIIMASHDEGVTLLDVLADIDNIRGRVKFL